MTSRDFAFWLQGFFEITEAEHEGPVALSAKQAQIIKAHLSLVFIHEIDPSMGNDAHQKKLNEKHTVPMPSTGRIDRLDGRKVRC
jgi:hypothetical protein